MTPVGEREIRTQQRVAAFLGGALGYARLGDWKRRAGNANVEEARLAAFLARRGHDERIAGRAIRELRKAAALGGGATLYDANRAVYGLLRYGVKVLPAAGGRHETVRLIDWPDPAANDFAFAEEVTVAGENDRRPDLVLYVNGIALAVLELKRSTVSVAEGIRQSRDAQRKEFIRPFYATVQLLMAGNDTEGLRYGAIGTPEKHWLRWKEADPRPEAGGNPLLRELGQLCPRGRLLEMAHDFTVFDAGVRKTCRHNQYFGVRAAQARVRRREGGIIWHTQGSGKSLTMVWLAKWIREHVPNGRVLIVTDRTELDEQIEQVFQGVGERIRHTRSGADLVDALGAGGDWLVGSLIQKFGAAEEGDVDAFVADVRRHAPARFHAAGETFVFVDECHRTQSGKLHAAMAELLPGAMLIGFTGTPLLKGDKQRSIETFGPYIHTYKYDEAVGDRVVLDLRYEARDVDQRLTSQARVDQWFDLKTRGLTDVAKARLKRRWGTLRKVLSARDRLARIVDDILLDMETRPRLKSGRGNALLVSDSIHSACRLFEMFEQTDLRGKCAVVTSYRPAVSDVKGEETRRGPHREAAPVRRVPEDAGGALRRAGRDGDAPGGALRAGGQAPLRRRAGPDEAADRGRQAADRLRRPVRDLPLHRQADARPRPVPGDLPGQPPRRRRQGVRRGHRLQGPVPVAGAVAQGLHRRGVRRIRRGRRRRVARGPAAESRERLEEVREQVKALCEPVEPPRDTAAYLRFFCGAGGDAAGLKENERKRVALYQLVASLLRAWASLANEMPEAGYSAAETQAIRGEVDHYEKVRTEVRLASGDYVDMKLYEPAMRHLLDTYIRAEESERLSAFDDLTLVQLVAERGEQALDALPDGLRQNPEAAAETIENNVRRVLIDEMAVNPKYYEKMSGLLDALIRRRRREAIDYRSYLAKIVDLTRRIRQPEDRASYPPGLDTAARRALFDNLPPLVSPRPSGASLTQERPPPYGDEPDPDAAGIGRRKETATALDAEVRRVRKADWRGNRIKEREVRNAVRRVLGGDDALTERIFEIVKAQRDY